MLCENCKKRTATYHYMQSINGEKTEKHLCAECAAELEQSPDSFEKQLQNEFAGFFGGMTLPGRRTSPRTVCPLCGSSAEDIARSGYVGCAECYNVFDGLLGPYITKLHGRVNHCGRRPKNVLPDKTQKLDELRRELEGAVKAEEFEKAAKLRDEIKGMENNA